MLGCPDVFMGISTQANGRETAHSEEAWWAASSLVQPVPVVLILSPVAKAGLCVPPQGWSGKFIVKTHGKGQGRTPPESWGDCLRQGLDLLGSSGSTNQPPSPKKHSFKRGSRYSQLLVAVSEEALGGLSLAEGDGDGVGGDVSHGNFT